jgi:penicillin-insensitive murein endopeptidase
LALACASAPAGRPTRPDSPQPDPSASAPRSESPEELLDDVDEEDATDGDASAGTTAPTRGAGKASRKAGGRATERPSKTPATFRPEHPLDALGAEELAERVRTAPESLGSLSVGLPNAGRLLNGVAVPRSELFEPVAPGTAYATEETLRYLSAAVRKVHERFPETPPLHVGDVSSKTGGYLSPHLSHQSGRDVDLGFYYSKGRKWYVRGTEANLDVPRTWALVRAFVTETDVEMILLDHSIQRILKQHALSVGEDPRWVEDLFVSRPGHTALIRHVKGHQTHLHVRFFNPLAQRGAQLTYALLVEHQLIPPVVSYVNHVAKKGDSLIKLARVYGTTVDAIQRANGLKKKTLIIAKRTYKIPRTGGPPAVSGELTFPARRLPPFDPPERVSLRPR